MKNRKDDAHQVRTALFVDFDNIYINLTQHGKDIADQFATNPDQWLAWLEGMPGIHLGHESSARRILIRKCYLNPHSFSVYRPFFIRSAFEVVDCPPLTSRGKTSTDIHMVMDILDALHHPTQFNEFIILSGDADFTPVLLRLRIHDRRSAVLAAGYASPAYKAASDYLIDADQFIRSAIGVEIHEEEPGAHVDATEININGAMADLLAKMASRLHESAQIPEGIQASELPAIYMEFPEFRHSDHWLGFYSLRRLTEALLEQRDDLVFVEEDPWRVATSEDGPLPVESLPAPDSECPRPPGVQHDPNLSTREQVAECVQAVVRESSTPVSMAALAQIVNRYFPDQLEDGKWLGAGSFGNLLWSLDLGELEVSSVAPGFVYDPKRHDRPVAAETVDKFAETYPYLASLAQKIHRLTDTPYLMPEHYGILFRELTREINERGYQMSRTSKTVRDRCVERGAPVARSHVNFVLIGISHTGYRFGEENQEDSEQLGEFFLTNIMNLCSAAQLDLDPADQGQVREWIMGKVIQTTA